MYSLISSGLSCFFHLGNALLWKKFYLRALASGYAPFRWIKYTFSASVMILILAYTSGTSAPPPTHPERKNDAATPQRHAALTRGLTLPTPLPSPPGSHAARAGVALRLHRHHHDLRPPAQGRLPPHPPPILPHLPYLPHISPRHPNSPCRLSASSPPVF